VFVIVTFTFGIVAPDASVTVPPMAPVTVWPEHTGATAIIKNAATVALAMNPKLPLLAIDLSSLFVTRRKESDP
jgi:hypothetical protein